MKITLNELRQMVRNILSESVDSPFKASYEDNFMTITQTDVDEEFYKVSNDTNRINQVAELISNKTGYIITECVTFPDVKNQQQLFKLYDNVMNDLYNNDTVDEGSINGGKYEYSVFDTGEILVSYYEKSYAEDFIFKGYKEEEEEEEIVDDEYPRNWTSPEKF
jgi:hypothetical protein